MGRPRRLAASASRARVASFSSARSASCAACHSVSETTGGGFMALLSSFIFVVSARPTFGVVATPPRGAVEQLPGGVEDVGAAVVTGVGVVDDAVLEREGAQAMELVAAEVDLRGVLRRAEVEAAAAPSPFLREDRDVEADRGVRATRTACVWPAFDRRAEHEVVDEQLRAPVEKLGQRLRPVVGLEAVVLLDRDPRQRLPLPGELVAAARELLLLCQQRGAGGQPLLARPDDLAHDRISVEGDPPGSVSPGTLAGDTATRIPRVRMRAMRCFILASVPRSSPIDVQEG